MFLTSELGAVLRTTPYLIGELGAVIIMNIAF